MPTYVSPYTVDHTQHTAAQHRCTPPLLYGCTYGVTHESTREEEQSAVQQPVSVPAATGLCRYGVALTRLVPSMDPRERQKERETSHTHQAHIGAVLKCRIGVGRRCPSRQKTRINSHRSSIHERAIRGADTRQHRAQYYAVT